MKIGAIVRCDNRGLGIQSREFFNHIPCRALVVDVSKVSPGTPQHHDWYPGSQIWYFTKGGRIPSDMAKHFLDGLDILIAFETPYDYSIFSLAKFMGVKTVLQLNYEFLEYPSNLHTPDLFAAPSMWHYLHIPAPKMFLPVPVDTDKFTRTRKENTFVHIAGKPAVHDRNGTYAFLNCLKYVKSNITVELKCQQRLPDFEVPENVTIIKEYENKPNYADNYTGGVMVIPRKYGGLCLERGTRVRVSNSKDENIENLSVGDIVMDEKGKTKVTGVLSRTVNKYIKISICGTLLKSSENHIHLVSPTNRKGIMKEVLAKDIKKKDLMYLVKPNRHGLLWVDVGEKPVVKSLKHKNWHQKVRLSNGWARVMGLWSAEGHSGIYKKGNRKRGTPTVCWNFGPHEKHFAIEVAEFLRAEGINASVRQNFTKGTFGVSKCWVVRARSLWLYTFFNKTGLGNGAHYKTAPNFHASLAPSYIGGWMDGDGCISGGVIRGYSRSKELIKGIWHLICKCGVLAKITRGGQEVSIPAKYTQVVSKWTKRLKTDNIVPTRYSGFKEVQKGWLVEVDLVEAVENKLDVVSIETSSGRYIANNILTHNCLPVNESLAAGMPVIMTDISPNNTWLPKDWLVPANKTGSFKCKKVIDIYEVDPVALAEKIDQFCVPTFYHRQAEIAENLGHSISWKNLLPVYHQTFASLKG